MLDVFFCSVECFIVIAFLEKSLGGSERYGVFFGNACVDAAVVSKLKKLLRAVGLHEYTPYYINGLTSLFGVRMVFHHLLQ